MDPLKRNGDVGMRRLFCPRSFFFFFVVSRSPDKLETISFRFRFTFCRGDSRFAILPLCQKWIEYACRGSKFREDSVSGRKIRKNGCKWCSIRKFENGGHENSREPFAEWKVSSRISEGWGDNSNNNAVDTSRGKKKFDTLPFSFSALFSPRLPVEETKKSNVVVGEFPVFFRISKIQFVQASWICSFGPFLTSPFFFLLYIMFSFPLEWPSLFRFGQDRVPGEISASRFPFRLFFSLSDSRANVHGEKKVFVSARLVSSKETPSKVRTVQELYKKVGEKGGAYRGGDWWGITKRFHAFRLLFFSWGVWLGVCRSLARVSKVRSTIKKPTYRFVEFSFFFFSFPSSSSSS